MWAWTGASRCPEPLLAAQKADEACGTSHILSGARPFPAASGRGWAEEVGRFLLVLAPARAIVITERLPTGRTAKATAHGFHCFSDRTASGQVAGQDEPCDVVCSCKALIFGRNSRSRLQGGGPNRPPGNSASGGRSKSTASSLSTWAGHDERPMTYNNPLILWDSIELKGKISCKNVIPTSQNWNLPEDKRDVNNLPRCSKPRHRSSSAGQTNMTSALR